MTLPSCGGGGGSPAPAPPVAQPAFQPLTASEVTGIANRAAAAANVPMVIAVTDRSGNILAVFRKTGAPATVVGNFGQTIDANELAVSLARTASFFSHNEAPLSSRTVRFISGIHFPPGVDFVPNAALYGIENTNRGCTLSTNYIAGKALPPSRNIAGSGPGLGIATGKADLVDSQPNAVNPGGVPIYRGSTMMGGVGVVAGASGELRDVAEFAAAVGAGGLPPGIGGFTAVPNPLPAPGVVFVEGIALPFVNNLSLPVGFSAGTAAGSFSVGPVASPGPTPDGDLVAPAAGPLGGLTAAEVRQILNRAVEIAVQTRAIIRLPLGTRAKFVIAVADLDGTIIGMHRMADSTVFSIDVAATKARNMVYFNTAAAAAQDLPGVPPGTAVTNRTINFGAMPLYPPGLVPDPPFTAGPFFDIYLRDVANPCTQGFQPAGPNQSGIVFFPGSVGLYRNGQLIGGLGVSGDGVEQDDFVTEYAARGFEPPANIRADQVFVRNTRLPFYKFPRNPTD